jgi:MraZ protein
MFYFSSEYECKLDDKGRMVLPARIKAMFPEEEDVVRMVIKRGFEPCLTIYPFEEWMKIFTKVISLNEFVEEERIFQRNFLRGSTEIELDKTGRFSIPRSMLRYAQLDKDLLLIGIGARIEIWNPDRYEDHLMKDQQAFSRMAQKYLAEQPEAPTHPSDDTYQAPETSAA